MPKRNFGFVALCDAVYQDVQTNKAVLAGVYFGDVILEILPAELRVALYVEVIPDSDGNFEADLQFFIDGKHRGGGKGAITNGVAGKPFALMFPTFGLSLTEPATLEIKGSFDGTRAVPLLKKVIALRPADSSA